METMEEKKERMRNLWKVRKAPEKIPSWIRDLQKLIFEDLVRKNNGEAGDMNVRIMKPLELREYLEDETEKSEEEIREILSFFYVIELVDTVLPFIYRSRIYIDKRKVVENKGLSEEMKVNIRLTIKEFREKIELKKREQLEGDRWRAKRAAEIRREGNRFKGMLSVDHVKTVKPRRKKRAKK